MNKALEQFVKPEQLDGENSYKCSKYEGVVAGWLASGMGVSQEHPPDPHETPVSFCAVWEDTGSPCSRGRSARRLRVYTLERRAPLPCGGSVPHDWEGLRGAAHGSCCALCGPGDASVVSGVFMDSLLGEAVMEWGSLSPSTVKALALSSGSHPGFRVVWAGNL